MKTLFLLRGLPGSGKTFTANLLSEGKYPVISADQFFEDEQGNYNFNALLLKDAHEWCFTTTNNALSSGVEKVFVANTFTVDWEMEKYFEIAESHGYKVVSMIIENRHEGTNVHNVPKETVDKMRNRFTIKL